MTLSSYVLWTLIGCGLITWLSRILPFVLVKHFRLPDWLVNFLSFVPITIMTALFVENLLVPHPGHLPGIDWQNTLASLPAILTAVLTKILLAIVIVGVAAMAVIRLMGWG
jgi:branched-subunit amino acid transport protein